MPNTNLRANSEHNHKIIFPDVFSWNKNCNRWRNGHCIVEKEIKIRKMVDSVWKWHSGERRRRSEYKRSTKRIWMLWMTCTMNITGESNCIMQLSVGAHPLHEPNICYIQHSSATHAKRKRNQTNEFYYYFLLAPNMQIRWISFTSIHIIGGIRSAQHSSSRMAAATTLLTYYIEM